MRAVADVIPVGLCGRLRDPVCREDWALRIGKRSTMRKARVALARRLAIIMHAMLRDGTDFQIA